MPALCRHCCGDFDSTDDTLMRFLPLAAAPGASESSESPGWLEQLRNGPPAARIVAESEPAEHADPSLTLTELSAYELVGVLGRGGMGSSMGAAQTTEPDRGDQGPQPAADGDAGARRRFEREFRFWEACTILES